MNILRKIINYSKGKFKRIFIPPPCPAKKYLKGSYSQCGEDLIIKFIFNSLGIYYPSYLDIGAHHPYQINNTALFYKIGSRGINIEPNPKLFSELQKHRPEDINLNVGVAATDGELDFYDISASTLSTFSKEEALNYGKEGNYFIKDIYKVQVSKLESILKEYYDGRFPDFLNIDAEGIDEIIIKAIDFSQNYPLVICVETISFSTNGNGIKNKKIIENLKQNGYILYADTYINSIFVRKDSWITKIK